jgi:hypothetical protein
VTRETDHVLSYMWSDLTCEICKAPFKMTVFNRYGELKSIISYKEFENCENYAILESVSKTKCTTIHVCNFDQKSVLNVGRSSSMDIRISDVSVSRHHSDLILCADGTLAVTDEGSKFGTLKLLTKPLQIS